MADHGQDKGQYLLTEREQEALTILAREMVREARIAREPEREAAAKRLEDLMDAQEQHMQSAIDFFKHMTTLCGASIVGTLALIGAFLIDADPPDLIYLSLGLLGFAFAISGMFFYSESLGAWFMGGYGTGTGLGFDRFRWRDKPEEEVLEAAGRHRFSNRVGAGIVTITWFGGLYVLVLAYWHLRP